MCLLLTPVALYAFLARCYEARALPLCPALSLASPLGALSLQGQIRAAWSEPALRLPCSAGAGVTRWQGAALGGLVVAGLAPRQAHVWTPAPHRQAPAPWRTGPPQVPPAGPQAVDA